MRINLFKTLILIFFFASGAQAATTMATIKTLLAEKRVDEAIKILKEDHKTLLRTAQDRQNLSRWLSLFIFEDTMASYEKAVAFADAKSTEADAEFKKALAVEPYNKTLIQSYVSLLLAQERWKEALTFIEEKRAEQPYMDVFTLYAIHAKSQLGEKPAPPVCEGKDYEDIELKYCYLVQLIAKVRAAESKESLELKDLRAAARKIKIPEGYYWVWRGREDISDLQTYVNQCKALSEKDRKIYRIIPGVCAKQDEAIQKLKTVALIYEINNLGSLEERQSFSFITGDSL